MCGEQVVLITLVVLLVPVIVQGTHGELGLLNHVLLLVHFTQKVAVVNARVLGVATN
jgi:hypothetical protein